VSDLRARVGSRIKDLRVRLGLTQEQVGERALVSYKFLGEVERGDGNPTIDWLDRVAGALDATVKDLLADEVPRPTTYRPLSGTDYSVVREARDSLEAVLNRFVEAPGSKASGARYRKKKR
jgi:transcriptional regulator with XRE-family HTH domain